MSRYYELCEQLARHAVEDYRLTKEIFSVMEEDPLEPSDVKSWSNRLDALRDKYDSNRELFDKAAEDYLAYLVG